MKQIEVGQQAILKIAAASTAGPVGSAGLVAGMHVMNVYVQQCACFFAVYLCVYVGACCVCVCVYCILISTFIRMNVCESSSFLFAAVAMYRTCKVADAHVHHIETRCCAFTSVLSLRGGTSLCAYVNTIHSL